MDLPWASERVLNNTLDLIRKDILIYKAPNTQSAF